MALVNTHRQVVYRLLPQKESNWRWLEGTLEDQRQLYNAAFEERIDYYCKTCESLTCFDQCTLLTECRHDNPGMTACLVAIQRGTLKRLDFAFQSFFHRINSDETPSFSRFRSRRYFDTPAFGPMTIRRTGGKWYTIVCHEAEIEEPADSNGEIHPAPDMGRLEARGRRLQRRVARQKKGSMRREKAVRHLAKVRRKIANRCRNWHHRVSRELADKAGTTVVEGLKTANMTHTAKGTADESGRKLKARSGFNRVIPNTGWSSLSRLLGDKAANVITVNPAYTSQTCHECGTADSRNRRSQAGFLRVVCGHADLNAATNILASGIGASARQGAFAPVTREINAEAA